MRILSAFVGFLFVLFVLLLAFAGSGVVSLDLFGYNFTASFALLLLPVATLSFFLGALFLWTKYIAFFIKRIKSGT